VLPDASVIVACCTASARAFPRRTSAKIIASWPASSDPTEVLVGAHPHPLRVVEQPVGELLLGDSDLGRLGERVEQELGPDGLLGSRADLGLEVVAGLALAGEVLLERRLVVGRRCGPRRAVGPRSRPPARRRGTATSVIARSAASTLSRASAALDRFFTRRIFSARSARSSSTVSNSLASWANSSSISGNDRSATPLTVTVTSTGFPACSPATNDVEKVTVSPAESPVTASSMPSTRSPLPTR
jgi:hypothetical protein